MGKQCKWICTYEEFLKVALEEGVSEEKARELWDDPQREEAMNLVKEMYGDPGFDEDIIRGLLREKASTKEEG